MKHVARKRFGQHFLTDRGIIEDIIQAIDPTAGELMVEIGPGLAAMTQPLVERLGHLTVIELDRDLARHLQAHPQLKVVEADVLKVDFPALARDNSEDGSAKDGGDLGWASTGMFVPEFEQVMNQLAPGQIADPLVSRFGVHLLQVMARREAPLSEREQRELARNLVREKKIDEAFALWQQEVRGRAYVEFRSEL